MQILRKQDWFHSDGFPIVVERREPQQPFGLHTHEFSEIVVVTGGRGLHVTGDEPVTGDRSVTGDESYELSPGDAFVIGGDRPHTYVNMQDLRLLNVLFVPRDLPMGFQDLGAMPGFHALFSLEPAWRKRHRFASRLRLAPSELPKAIHLIEQLECELSTRGPGFKVMATTILLQLATFLARCYSESDAPQSRSLLRIAEAIAHLERHYVDPITLDELVDISGMSHRNFLRTFEATMGAPPIAYLIRLRIRRACRLLEDTDDSITEIALRVGFSDSNYFSRQFRKALGTSPRSYRKRVRTESH